MGREEVRPSSRLHATGRVERSGRRGRPKKVYADSSGTEFTYKRSKAWKPRFARGVPSKYPVGSFFPGSGQFGSRLVKRWNTFKCSECGGIKYIVGQFCTQLSRKDSDGKWRTFTTPIKQSEVYRKARTFILPKPILDCTCTLSKTGFPRRSVVEPYAMALSVEFDRGAAYPVSSTNRAKWPKGVTLPLAIP